MPSLAVVITRDTHLSIGGRLDNLQLVVGAVPWQIPGTVSDTWNSSIRPAMFVMIINCTIWKTLIVHDITDFHAYKDIITPDLTFVIALRLDMSVKKIS